MGTNIVEFRQLREIGVFFYLDYCLKSHENGLFWSYEAGIGHAFQFQGSGTKGLMRGLSLDGLRQNMGILCTVRNLFWTEIHQCVIACMLLVEMSSMCYL